MKTIEVQRQIQKLESLISAAPKQSNQIEMLGHWARYCCVLASGLLENSIAELYGKYVEKRSAPEVGNFAISKLRGIQNPKAEKFLQVARSFDPQWAEDLEKYMAEDGRKDAIDSIMATRHLIAHGKDAGISLVNIQGYLRRSVEVLEFIEKQLGL